MAPGPFEVPEGRQIGTHVKKIPLGIFKLAQFATLRRYNFLNLKKN